MRLLKSHLFALVALVTSLQVQANEKPKIILSPFAPTVQGVSIPNTHEVARADGFVLRGMTPLTTEQVKELADIGINHILIFRADSPGETGIADEKALIAQHPRIRNVTNIQFPWKDLSDFGLHCRNTVEALRIIRDSLKTPGEGLFFHCTVGEDRTGYLAGLYRVLFEGVTPHQALKSEMCTRGYAEADPTKPQFVIDLVHANVTPLYLKMNELIAKGVLTQELDLRACDIDPATDEAFAKRLQSEAALYRCQ